MQLHSFKPSHPTFLYDADCGFCLSWVDYFQSVVGDAVAFEPYQRCSEQISEYSEQELARAVHLVEPDGTITEGAEATFRMLAYARRTQWWLWCYRYLPGFARVSEWVYRMVASHRTGAFSLTKLLWGVPIRDGTYRCVRELFLRGIGIVYLIAFSSFAFQMTGLIGERGILPVQMLLDQVWRSDGIAAVWQVPTVFWLHAGNTALWTVATIGVIASVALMLGRMKRTALAVAFVAYLSFVAAGQMFMGYQWDALLLETGLLALLWAVFMPALWALRVLLFKVMLMSGLGKLVFGSGGWHDLTALTHHFETQPLPTPLAWHVHQLPDWLLKAATAGTLFVEVAVPFFFFAPRRVRFAAGILTVILELAILLTGNYTFFNLLTILLALTLFDDRAVRALIPTWVAKRCADGFRELRRRWARITAGIAVSLLIILSVFQALTFGLPQPLRAVHTTLQPFRISNTYGLFISMTTRRPEVIIQGSRDKQTWRSYEFAYKPDTLTEAPPIVAPHQPRLDWQLWFAALRGHPDRAPWFSHFVVRLLQNEHVVTDLLERNPFPERPPTYVRAVLYDYSFAPADSDRWWQRERIGVYLPPVSLQDYRR